jgi:hypothetical protein
MASRTFNIPKSKGTPKAIKIANATDVAARYFVYKLYEATSGQGTLIFPFAPTAVPRRLSAQQSLLGKSCLGTFDTRKSTDGEYDLGAAALTLPRPCR